MKLYELTENYIKFNEYAEEMLEQEDLTEEDLQMLIDNLDAIKDSIEIKAENTCKFMKHLENDIKSFKAEEDRLAKKRKTLTNTYDGLKDYIKSTLEKANLEKVQAGIFALRLQKNPPSSEVIDVNKLPDKYKIPQDPKIDNKQILADLKLGVEIEGARFSEEKKHLRIS